jgi:hypothetical protein
MRAGGAGTLTAPLGQDERIDNAFGEVERGEEGSYDRDEDASPGLSGAPSSNRGSRTPRCRFSEWLGPGLSR